MSRELVKRGEVDGHGEVSNCVSNLIYAFTNGLNIFKRLRERRRKRKKKSKNSGREEGVSGEELRLSNSLRRGPKDISERYSRCYGEKGDIFAKGDAIAHASLAETLIKLNTGLVGIIATFLNHDSKNTHLHLDYKSLTNLSDASRREAIESMSQLHQRLNRSQLQLHRMASPKADMEKKKHAGSRQKVNGTNVARVPVKSTSQTQLAFVRPKGSRKGSSSSGSSTKSPSTAMSSPYASPLGSPLPQYTPIDPFPPQKASATKGRRRAGSFEGPRPTTWPDARREHAAPVPAPIPPPKVSTPRKTPPLREKYSSPPPSAGLKRRIDKATPSTYTFASDSTKLGEIPQRNWTVPWNYEEAERLNAEVAVTGYPSQTGGGEGKSKKKGLFGFLRRGNAQAA